MGLFDKQDKYLVDIMGVSTIATVSKQRYDDIYNEPTVMYSIQYENKSLNDLGDDTDKTYQPSRRCNHTGVNIVSGKRLKEYQLPFSETGYRSDISNMMKYDENYTNEKAILESCLYLLKESGIHRDKYFDTETFEDKPIVSVEKILWD
jgi:hypothetical protein